MIEEFVQAMQEYAMHWAARNGFECRTWPELVDGRPYLLHVALRIKLAGRTFGTVRIFRVAHQWRDHMDYTFALMLQRPEKAQHESVHA